MSQTDILTLANCPTTLFFSCTLPLIDISLVTCYSLCFLFHSRSPHSCFFLLLFICVFRVVDIEYLWIKICVASNVVSVTYWDELKKVLKVSISHPLAIALIKKKIKISSQGNSKGSSCKVIYEGFQYIICGNAQIWGDR